MSLEIYCQRRLVGNVAESLISWEEHLQHFYDGLYTQGDIDRCIDAGGPTRRPWSRRKTDYGLVCMAYRTMAAAATSYAASYAPAATLLLTFLTLQPESSYSD
jgi:hypothetical protein